VQTQIAYRERSRGIARSRPTPAAIETEALVGDDLEDASALESLRIGLAFDLEDIEGKQDNFADTDQTSKSQKVSGGVLYAHTSRRTRLTCQP
jgi:hypothetical protein